MQAIRKAIVTKIFLMWFVYRCFIQKYNIFAILRHMDASVPFIKDQSAKLLHGNTIIAEE